MAKKQNAKKLNIPDYEQKWDALKTKGKKKAAPAKLEKKSTEGNSSMSSTLDGKNLTVKINLKTIDSTNLAKFDKQLRNLIETSERYNITFDMDNVRYCSSSVIRRMVMLQNADFEISIINVGRELYDLFMIIGLDKMMDIKTII